MVMHMDESKKISTDYQWEYQSGVGMLLYLVKHSQLDIANATRELSTADNDANPVACKESYVWFLDLRILELKIELTGNTNKP